MSRRPELLTTCYATDPQCHRPTMPPTRYAVDPQCRQPAMLSTRHAVDPQCRRTALPPILYVTDPQCRRPAMPPTRYAVDPPCRRLAMPPTRYAADRLWRPPACASDETKKMDSLLQDTMISNACTQGLHVFVVNESRPHAELEMMKRMPAVQAKCNRFRVT